ncbi:hypothetical protein HYALB_00009498 [Hymenoscyphus albidus]|uniref:RCC1/BLIP-II protein n=1 Tax=Hymenoscyphus albidus TaxID=595503 RepID=A0A9N9Q1K1_9HELO|nr:hypothetical protein HYALB_00009498 [Hymenoscyphus albidus]
MAMETETQPGMTLWACGFNAFSQLTEKELGSEEEKLGQEDLRKWSRIFTSKDIDFFYGDFSIFTSTSSTLEHQYLGLPTPQNKARDTVHIDHSTQLHNPQHLPFPSPSPKPRQLATISSGALALIPSFNQKAIWIYNNPIPSQPPTSRFAFPTAVTSIVGNLAAFHVLTEDGVVYSLGDARFPALLGREVIESRPASNPFEIPDLIDLPTGPITKIASGGTLTAAITAGNDLYIWGQVPLSALNSSSGYFLPFFDHGDGEMEHVGEGVISVDIYGLDVIDVAVGRDYMLAVTTDEEGDERKVWGIGSNAHGQLGLGDVEGVREWVEMSLKGLGRGVIKGVWTGYENSFLVVGDGQRENNS